MPGRGSSSIQVRPGCNVMTAPEESTSRTVSVIEGRCHVPAMTFPSRRIQHGPEPVAMSSGSSFPAVSKMPVGPMATESTTTLGVEMRDPPAMTSGAPFWLRRS